MSSTPLTSLVQSAGCAAKLAPGALSEVLRDLPRVDTPDLLVGYDASDDAAVYDLHDGRVMVQTLDFFPPMVDDPHLFGRIAATNALSDIYAMGATPAIALNILCAPNCLGLEVIGDILAGGAAVCAQAGCTIAGGHSINVREPAYGLSVTGFAPKDQVLTNAGARVGDALILTKALGTGIIMTAHKGGLAQEEELDATLTSMTTLNSGLAGLDPQLRSAIHAATDITGFSLLGHASEMAQASDTTLVLCASEIPLLPGAEAYARLGIVPTGTYNNRRFFSAGIAGLERLTQWQEDVFFDPQTSGGLLLSVNAAYADKIAKALGDGACVVGSVEPREACACRIA